MEKKERQRFEAVIPEGISRYYTEAAGWWGEMIDKLTSEERIRLLEVLDNNEPLYSERELKQEIGKARKEVLMEIRDELLEQIEKGRKYNIYGGVADYQDALHLVMGMLSKLKE